MVRKVPVTERALLQRINRKLAADNEVLKRTRGEKMKREFGDYYHLDLMRNCILGSSVDLEKWGREMKVMAEWEALAKE
jgi:hypothetical protein